jgi:hypothetical protein
MFSDYKIRNISSWTMLIFGLMAFILGLVGILRPEFLLWQLGFEIVERSQRAGHDYTLVFIVASSMASFNMGAYYVLAAFHNLKSFYRWTVPFRAVTFTVFTGSVILGLAPQRFLMVGVWELVGAMATGAALYYERKQEKEARREPHPSAKDAAPGDGRSG